MNKNPIHVFTYITIIIAIATLFTGFLSTVSASETWYVDKEGDSNFTKIQDAIDSSNAGDTIIVRNGTYIENIRVDKPLTVRSHSGSAFTVVKAANLNDHVFLVTADYTNISGFFVEGATGSDKSGIYITSVSHSNISDNIISGNHNGISLYFSDENMVLRNIVDSNSKEGIFFHSSINNTLSNNTVLNNWRGIYLEYSGNCNLIENKMQKNNFNFGVWGGGWEIGFSDYTQRIGIGNKVDNKPIYYWCNQKNRQIPSDAGYVGVINSTNITMRDLTIKNNSQGVLLMYSNDSRIENVNSSSNLIGIYLYSSNNNTLKRNIVNSNEDYGIFLVSSNNNKILNNNANSNLDHAGIYLSSSNQNKIEKNIVRSNKICGIYIGGHENLITKNTVSNSNHGIYLGGSKNNTIISNTVDSSDTYDIYLSRSENNVFKNNTARSNVLYQSKNNTIENNIANIWLVYPNGTQKEGNVLEKKEYLPAIIVLFAIATVLVVMYIKRYRKKVEK